MTQGNGSDQAAMEYGLEYNPPMNPVTGERNLKEIKTIYMSEIIKISNSQALPLLWLKKKRQTCRRRLQERL